MIGLADGIDSGANLYLGLQERRQAQRLRDEQNARAAEQHALQMREGGLRVGGLQRVNDATDRLSALQNVGARDQPAYDANEADFNAADQANLAGLPMPAYKAPRPEFRKATDRELLGGMRGLAAAKGDAQGMLALRDREKVMDEDEILAKAEPDDKTISLINNDHRRITVGDADKRGFRPLSYTTLDGKGAFVMLNKADQKLLAGAQALMETNPTRAMQIIAGVNKGLAETLARDAGAQSDAVKTGNTTAFQSGTLDHQDAQTAAQAAYWKAMEANDSARTQAMLAQHKAATGKTVPPEIIAKLGALEQQFLGTDDPKMRATIERQYQMALSQAGVAVGKPMGLPNAKTQREGLSAKDEVEAALKLVEQSGGKLSLAGARAMLRGSYDPEAVMRAAVERKLAEKAGGAKPAAGLQPPPQGRAVPTRMAWDENGPVKQFVPDPRFMAPQR